jgi:hypothetical protein
MSYQAIREYQIQQKAKNVAETPWLVFPGPNKLTRRALKISFIKDNKDSNKFVGLHAEILFQKRKSEKDSWPEKMVDLRNVPNDFGLKIQLDTAQTYELSQALQDAYPIGEDNIASGRRTVIRGVGKDEIIVTEKNKIEVLKKVSVLLSENEISDWVLENIGSLSADVAIMRLYRERKSQLAEFEKALKQNNDENFWQKFLKKNSWMFGVTCVQVLDERRLDIHHATDFPLQVDGGFMDIVEIKKPGLPFWTLLKNGQYYKYRSKFLVPNPELQGALAQITKYILQEEKERSDRLSLEIKETIEDAIERNIPAVGFIGEHYDFLNEKLLDFQRLFEHLGYKIWKTHSLATSELMIYVIFDLEHFGMKDEYNLDNDKINLNSLLNEDENTCHLSPIYEKPFKFDQHELDLCASVGLAIFPEDGNDPDVLVDKADQVMYADKKSKKNK